MQLLTCLGCGHHTSPASSETAVLLHKCYSCWGQAGRRGTGQPWCRAGPPVQGLRLALCWIPPASASTGGCVADGVGGRLWASEKNQTGLNPSGNVIFPLYKRTDQNTLTYLTFINRDVWKRKTSSRAWFSTPVKERDQRAE